MLLDTQVEAYIKLRNKRKKIKELYTERDKELKVKMDKIEMEILDFLKTTGQESAKTKFGTAYKQRKTSATVSDGNEFFKFVLKHAAIDLLEKRVNKTAYLAYLDDKIEVPGVALFTESKVMIRKN